MAQFRIPQIFGGDESIVADAVICNATGSQLQTTYEHDFDRLNGPAHGRHLFPPVPRRVNTPNGAAMVPTVWLISELSSAIKTG